MAQRGKIDWIPVRGLVAQNRADKPDFRTFPLSLEKRGVEPEGNLYGTIVNGDTTKTVSEDVV